MPARPGGQPCCWVSSHWCQSVLQPPLAINLPTEWVIPHEPFKLLMPSTESLPLSAAIQIARAKTDDDNLGDMLEEAYQSGELKTTQLYEAKQLLAKRRDQGPKANNRPKLPNSAHSLVKTYQREVERQHKMVLKAEHAQQKLLLVEQGLRTLFTDTNFVTLLRAEGLETLPQYLAERIELKTLNGGVS